MKATIASFISLPTQQSYQRTFPVIQNVPGEKVNIMGGHSIGHSKREVYMNMCRIPIGFRFLARNIFFLSRRNAPLSEACGSV
jgi:hypothetical protein